MCNNCILEDVFVNERYKEVSYSNRKPVYGVGINDSGEPIRLHAKAYKTWNSMLSRCYNSKYTSVNKTYERCEVCEEWKFFSCYKKWFDENYVDGYSLDKDILCKHNKIYSPVACCFVPQEINSLLCKSDKARGACPIGVSKMKIGDKIKFAAHLNKYKEKGIYLGLSDTPEEAFNAYKNAKESYIKEVAQKYYNDGKITMRVYDALMRYEVEITD